MRDFSVENKNIRLLNDQIAGCLADISSRVKRSLVVVQNGRGVGAGMVWRRDGIILTNQHVVGRDHVRVTLANGLEVGARLVASDPEVDLAVLRVEASDLPAILVADSRGLNVGQLVLAVGHPWGQKGMVTMGMIAGLTTAQTRGRRGKVPIIRSDVELAPGSSGGPLVNAAGGVVGINTMIVGGDLSVAIPSYIAAEFVQTALTEGAEYRM